MAICLTIDKPWDRLARPVGPNLRGDHARTMRGPCAEWAGWAPPLGGGKVLLAQHPLEPQSK